MCTFKITMKAFEGQQQPEPRRYETMRRRGARRKDVLLRLLVLLPLSLIALFQPPVVTAAPNLEGTSCVLACNAKTRRCSRYASDAVPGGYRIQNGIPPGYKLVRSGSACDSKMCPTKSKSICSTSPIGQATTSVDR